jgi:CO dehydrogenase/acetyl-CoA synthase gamma subunit (corrinoid Fe-S protein)
MTYAWIVGYLIMDIVAVSSRRTTISKNRQSVRVVAEQVLKVALCALGACF